MNACIKVHAGCQCHRSSHSPQMPAVGTWHCLPCHYWCRDKCPVGLHQIHQQLHIGVPGDDCMQSQILNGDDCMQSHVYALVDLIFADVERQRAAQRGMPYGEGQHWAYVPTRCRSPVKCINYSYTCLIGYKTLRRNAESRKEVHVCIPELLGSSVKWLVFLHISGLGSCQSRGI